MTANPANQRNQEKVTCTERTEAVELGHPPGSRKQSVLGHIRDATGGILVRTQVTPLKQKSLMNLRLDFQDH